MTRHHLPTLAAVTAAFIIGATTSVWIAFKLAARLWP